MSHWNDFNDADNQSSFDLIPAKTHAKVRMTLKPGGVDNPHMGWTGGYATRSQTTGSVYLNAEFVVLAGPFARRKVWSLIGLHSEKGPEWANIGRSFLRAALNSARNIHPQDQSPQAQQARCIQGFQDLDGLEFVVRIDVEPDQKGEHRNQIRTVIQPDHPEYAALMGQTSLPVAPVMAAMPGASVPSPSMNPLPSTAGSGRPAWAQ